MQQNTVRRWKTEQGWIFGGVGGKAVFMKYHTLAQEIDFEYNVFMEHRLYLDNCCFNRPYDDQTVLKNYLEAEAKIYIQKEILLKRYELAWSYMMDYEIAFNPFDDRKIQILKWKNFAVVDIDESKEIIDLANKITVKGIKPKDSLHLSCAIKARCNFFVTTDAKILNKVIDAITVIDPIDFIKRLEE